MVIYANYLSYHFQSRQCDYVFHTPNQKHFTYRNYYDSYWNPFMVRFEYDQTPHCCRHTEPYSAIFLSTCLLSAVLQSLFEHRISFCGHTFCERFWLEPAYRWLWSFSFNLTWLLVFIFKQFGNQHFEFTQSSWRSNKDFQTFISSTINNNLYRSGVRLTTMIS